MSDDGESRTTVDMLRELEAMRAEIIANLGHQIRTPLTAIGGYIEMLLDGDAGPVTDEQRAMLLRASINAQRLGVLVTELLILARSDAGAARGCPASLVELRELVRRACATMQATVEQREQHLSMSLPDRSVWVRGDADQLDRAIGNLLSNASKFTPSGGEVWVDMSPLGAEVELVVADTGMGVSLRDQAKMFDRFYRSADAELAGIPGTGLGLAVVKTIIDQHRGRLDVQSDLGVGSRFTVWLPLVSA